MEFKRTISLVLILSLVVTLAMPIGTPVYAASDPGNYFFDISEGRITVSAGTDSDTLKVSYGAAQVLDNIPEAQEITIRGSIEENSENRIVVNIPGQTAAINIDNINIELTTGNLCAFSIDGGTVNLRLSGTNTLKSTGENAGLRVTNGKTLNISGTGSEETGSLNVTGAYKSAGIGGGFLESVGTINIHHGTIIATGGKFGSGIGGGDSSEGGIITINGGAITALGGESGSGIGGATTGSVGIITINSGTINATGGDFGAGIGAYETCDRGVITINGGTITASAGDFGSGISGGPTYLNGGTITAFGGDFGSGIGGNKAFSSIDPVRISSSATIFAFSDASGPAIKAADNTLAEGSTATIMMANFTDNQSSGTTTEVYIKSPTSLKASYTPLTGYSSIAFTIPPADTYQLKTADLIQKQGSNWDPDFVINGTGLTVFDNVAPYDALSVTVNKDGVVWTQSTPSIKLSMASNALTDAITGICVEGVYTFTDLVYGQTYYAWDETNNQYTGQSVSLGGTGNSVNYYTVTLSKGTGIDSTSGVGTYLSGSDVSISATVSDGYNWAGWTLTSDDSEVSTTRNYQITGIDSAQSYTANANESTIGDSTYWIDEGNYDNTFYETLTSPGFADTTVDISTPQQLAVLARVVDIDGLDFSGVTFELTQDIDLYGYLWDPIGIAEGDTLHGEANGDVHPFKGNFDGNGYTISNMTIEGSYSAAGLFGVVGVVDMEDSDAETVEIRNITVDGTIDVTDTICVAGIVGSGGLLHLEECINEAVITCTSDLEQSVAGGIIGMGMMVLLDGCVNEVGADIDMTNTSDSPDTMTMAAGIAGTLFYGDVYNSVNFASVTASSTEEVPITGGIIGMAGMSTIGNCYNTGNISADGSDSMAGGICGANVDMMGTDVPYIQNCYNAGLITATMAAGIAATVNAIDNCYFLSGTAEYTYYDAAYVPYTVDESVKSDSEMQSSGFCDILNGWVTDNPVSNGISETYFGLNPAEFQGWILHDGVNNNYPVFENDTRVGVTYDLTVNLNGGNGTTTGGSYPLGETLSINAGAKSNYTFNGWTSSNGGTFADATSPSTRFIMPKNATTITANWTKNRTSNISLTNNTIVIIDGTDYAIGHEARTGSSTTATVDQYRLTNEITDASDGSLILFPVSANSNITAQLVVKNIEDMAQRNMTLTVQTGNISYNLDTTAIDTQAIMEALDTRQAESITFSVGISKSNALVNGATVIVFPVEFTITCTYNGQTVTVDTFSSFLSRTVEITAEQAGQVTTAVVIQPDGTLHQVPTKVVTKTDSSGTIHYYVVINSLTNSTYTVIQNTVGFADVAVSWAKDAINDMGSRMIVSGVGGNHYEPDRDITRAEFAAIIVKALGLKPDLGKNKFNDVHPASWYCGYIETAVSYGLIKGYGDGTFGPDEDITREQAMVIVAMAMKLTKISPNLTEDQTTNLIEVFIDSGAASGWANEGIAACLETGIIKGRTSTMLCSKENITRAEVAIIIQRLLQKSELI
ncbi:MAG: hypothetical protein AVO33_08040 [delta proteobacterium ML8_F1]|nr:MAG: hypothetical protein AVO33_08040 [delta proteobacterium ML8_F1]